MKRSGRRRSWIVGVVFLAVGLVAVLTGLRAPRPAAARTTAMTTLSTCGDCGCTNCGSSACNCTFNPFRGTTSCSIDCVLCSVCADGVAGGGVLQLDARQATVALFATTEKEDKPDNVHRNPRATGLLRWVDPGFEGGALTLESVGLSDYASVAANTREIRGYVLANQAGPYPFLLRVVAEPGGGNDSLDLAVGDAADGGSDTGFSYSAQGPLVAGDLVGTWTPPQR